jgi:hypothetical protein
MSYFKLKVPKFELPEEQLITRLYLSAINLGLPEGQVPCMKFFNKDVVYVCCKCGNFVWTGKKGHTEDWVEFALCNSCGGAHPLVTNPHTGESEPMDPETVKECIEICTSGKEVEETESEETEPVESYSF